MLEPGACPRLPSSCSGCPWVQAQPSRCGLAGLGPAEGYTRRARARDPTPRSTRAGAHPPLRRPVVDPGGSKPELEAQLSPRPQNKAIRLRGSREQQAQAAKAATLRGTSSHGSPRVQDRHQRRQVPGRRPQESPRHEPGRPHRAGSRGSAQGAAMVGRGLCRAVHSAK